MNSAPDASVTVIIAVRNEALTIVECVSRILARMPRAEIIVVDGGNDETPSLLEPWLNRNPNLIYYANKNDRGKGHAISAGIRLASRPILVQFDGDLQFVPEEIPRLVQPILDDKTDFVIGSRFLPESRRLSASVPGLRSFGNRVFSFYLSLLCGQPIYDGLTGIKAWRKEVTESFRLTSHTYAYEMELVIKALRRNFRLQEVPVTTLARQHGRSSVRPYRLAGQMLFSLPLFRFQPL